MTHRDPLSAPTGYRPSRRAALGLLGAVPLAATGVLAAGPTRSTASATPVGAAPVPADLRPGGALDRLAAQLAGQDAFAGTLLLLHHDRPVLARSYGMADKARAIPNRPGTIFSLGSITKLFTAVAVAQLAERGDVAYHETLGTYLDGFPADIADTVTVHHLLTHTSGMGDYMQADQFWAEYLGWTTPAQVMDGITALIRTLPLAFPPGAGWTYSNSAYHLLGAIVAKVSGLSYHDYVRTHVFAAAGMASSDFYTRDQWRADPRIAHPYRGPAGGRTDDVDQRLFIGTPAGDAFSTCQDLGRFARALLGHRLVGRLHTDITLSPKVPIVLPAPPPHAPPGPPLRAAFSCYGPVYFALADQRVIWHNGGAPGVSTELQTYPDSGWVFVVLSNYDLHTVDPIAALARSLITRE
jgi:CubicO group peptidase (beta-lactamase class C family)